MTSDAFSVEWQRLLEYRRMAPDAAQARVYLRALQRVDDRDWPATVDLAIARCTGPSWPPYAADLLELAAEVGRRRVAAEDSCRRRRETDAIAASRDHEAPTCRGLLTDLVSTLGGSHGAD